MEQRNFGAEMGCPVFVNLHLSLAMSLLIELLRLERMYLATFR